MFIFNNAKGETLYNNEVYEEGFNNTIRRFKEKSISSFKNDVIGNYLKGLQDTKTNIKKSEVIPTGIKSLDEKLGGGLRAGLYVIGAIPGMGKSSFLLHILMNIAEHKRCSLYFNLDMSELQTSLRLLANSTYRNQDLENMTINELSNPKLLLDGEHIKDSIREIYRKYHTTYDPYINVISPTLDNKGNDSAVNDVASVEVAIKNVQLFLNANPVVVIDFLQRMENKLSSSTEEDNSYSVYDKRLEIDKVINELKRYSSIYNVPIIVITSMNRSSYSKSSFNENSEYDLSFSKESGNIEYMADVLIRITAGEETTVLGGPKQKKICLNIVKSRFGLDHVSIPLDFIPEYAYFKELEEGDQLWLPKLL